MLSRRQYLFFIAVTLTGAAIIFHACNKESAAAPDPGYAYYPYEVGKYITYSLDSVIFDDFNNTIDTFHCEVQDRYESTFSDNQGRLSYRIARYIKDTSGNWQPDMAYYITPTNTRIEYVENNLRYIKMVFPVIQDYSWNGNAYIDPAPEDDLQYLDGWDYTFTKVDKPDTVLNMRFDSTLTVMEKDDSIAIPAYAYRLYSEEKYARNIGLIYRHFIHWEQQCASYNQSGDCQGLSPKKGVEVIMRIIDHN